MMLVHDCTMKREAHEALRCLDHLASAKRKVLSENEKNTLSLASYSALVIKNVRICAENEPKKGTKQWEKPDDWKALGHHTHWETPNEGVEGHPCGRSKGSEGRPDVACDQTFVSGNFLICFHDMMVEKHEDLSKFIKAADNKVMNDKAKELFLFVDTDDPVTKDEEAKKKTSEWYAEKQKKFVKRNSDDQEKKAATMRRSAMWMSVANLNRIKQGLDRFKHEKRLQGEVMGVLCWEDYVKIAQCDEKGEHKDEEEDESKESRESRESGLRSCVPVNNYVEYFPSGNGLIQELASFTWEIAHAKCEPTLGLAYAQVLDLTTMFPLSKSNLHFHLVANRPPSKHSDCYVFEQMEKCAEQYDSSYCLCPQAEDYQGFQNPAGDGTIWNPDWINSKKMLRSDEHQRGTLYFRANKAIAVFATVMNDWAAMKTYPRSVRTEFLTPWDSKDAEKLLILTPNGYLQKNNARINDAVKKRDKERLERGNLRNGPNMLADGRYENNDNNFMDNIETKDGGGHNWGTFKRAYVAFRTANVYKGTRFGFEFRGGLQPAPSRVIKKFTKTMTGESDDPDDSVKASPTTDDTSSWEKSVPWEHPLFLQQAILNLDAIGRFGLDAVSEELTANDKFRHV